MPSRGHGWVGLVLFSLALAAAPAAAAEETTRGFEVQLHLRDADGKETTRRVSDLHFIYYERRFIHKSTGIGNPARVEIKDLPHDATSVQNERLDKWKFKKLARIRFEYRDVEGKRVLFLLASFLKPKAPDAAWPAYELRNASVSLAPHFRGMEDGKQVDIPLPALKEAPSPTEPVLTSIEFQFPGQKKRRDWF
jgi:hypothetical protein